MKTFMQWLAIGISMGLTFGTMGAAFGDTIQLSPGFPEPKTTTGTSGGSQDSGHCGYISQTPNHQIILTEDFDYLRVWANGEEGLTLLVQGPGGEFCAPRDPQQSGYWQEGTYSIFVGDGSEIEREYTLSISADPQSASGL